MCEQYLGAFHIQKKVHRHKWWFLYML